MLFTLSIKGSELFDYLAATIKTGTDRKADVFYEANYRYLVDLDYTGGYSLRLEDDAIILADCTLGGFDEVGGFVEGIESGGLINGAEGHLREIEDVCLWRTLEDLGLEPGEIQDLLLHHGDDVFGHVDRATDQYVFPEFDYMVETLFPLVRA